MIRVSLAGEIPHKGFSRFRPRKATRPFGTDNGRIWHPRVGTSLDGQFVLDPPSAALQRVFDRRVEPLRPSTEPLSVAAHSSTSAAT